MSDPTAHVTDSGREDVLPERLRRHLEQDYAIEGEIGRGGMATVWRATRRRDNTVVAIKVLRPVLAEAVGSKRFLREVEIAARTRSEFLVPLEEAGELEGLPYYVMPFVEDGTLRRRMLRERQLPLDEAVRIARGIALALTALHRDGIVHRDVKPENVLLRGGRDVLVADYGIARAISASATEDLTSTGIVLGTPAYMSPEQAAGDPVDARSDQYSWGCLVYEMLLGVPPFHGATSQAVMARHRHDTAPSLRVVRSSVPESLEAVVRRAMGKLPADRFANVEELVEALDRVDLTQLDSISRRERRWRRLATAAAIGIAAIAAAWGGWRWTHPALDSDRVVLFPLTSADSTLQVEAARVSALVRSALEDIEPERFLDGAARLAPGQRALPIEARRGASITRRMRSRSFVAGTITRSPHGTDSVQVSFALHDVDRGMDTTVAATGAGSALADVALSAVIGLLPRLTGLEQQINPASLAGRSLPTVSNWLRGEHEYRSSRMRTALEYLQRAVAADSSLAPAAIRGAMAAIWLNDDVAATQLVSVAQQHAGLLTSRQAAFAEALRLYLAGTADSAIVAIRKTLAVDSTWAEPWMLTGEIFLHMQPSVPLDSELVRAVPPPVTWPLEQWAEEAFRRARTVDPGFTPPLAHLAQAAARRDDIPLLQSLQRELLEAGADSSTLAGLSLAQRCLTSRMAPADWAGAARASRRNVFYTGVILTNAVAPRAHACAAGAWSALAGSDSATASEQWAATMSRFASHAAAGDNEAALALVDSAVASGMNAALGLYFVGAAAGIDPAHRVDDFVKQLDAAIETRPAPSLWLLTLWSARTADTARLARVRARLEHLKANNGTRLDTLIGDVVQAWQALARQDTLMALRAFGALVPRAPTPALQTTLWESLAAERLAYARLLLATGSPAAAHRVASVFDQPGLYINPLFLRPSLELRARAARALGDETLRRAAEDRLRHLSPGSR